MSTNRKCPFCTDHKDSAFNSEFLIQEFSYGYLLLHQNQSYGGRCLFVFKDHYENVWDIPSYEIEDFNRDLMMISEALKDVFKADLINICTLGNKVRHFHYHLIPRNSKDSNWGGPPWPNKEKKLNLEEYKKIIKILKLKIEQYVY